MRAMTFTEVGIRHRNGITANVVLGDIDLNVQGQTFQMLVYRKR